MPDKNPLITELKRTGVWFLLVFVGFPVIVVSFLGGFICQMAVLGFTKGAKALDVFPDPKDDPLI